MKMKLSVHSPDLGRSDGPSQPFVAWKIGSLMNAFHNAYRKFTTVLFATGTPKAKDEPWIIR
jgi:hypothetical protein